MFLVCLSHISLRGIEDSAHLFRFCSSSWKSKKNGCTTICSYLPLPSPGSRYVCWMKQLGMFAAGFWGSYFHFRAILWWGPGSCLARGEDFATIGFSLAVNIFMGRRVENKNENNFFVASDTILTVEI